ncbi:MAG: hypothetical protein JXQ90_23875 [Cyclobacteriaceae bacterium]
MKYFFICFSILFGCVSNKQSPPDLSTVDPGINKTAVYGEVISFTEIDNGAHIKLKVKSSKQGGAGSATFRIGEELNCVAPPAFIRKYEENSPLKVKGGDVLILVIEYNERKQQYLISKIVTNE